LADVLRLLLDRAAAARLVVDLRAVVLRAVDFRAVVFRAVDFRAVDRRAVLLRAVVLRPLVPRLDEVERRELGLRETPASDMAMATACLRLFTLRRPPDFSWPRLYSSMTLATFLRVAVFL
jgi:hypothetical protein